MRLFALCEASMKVVGRFVAARSGQAAVQFALVAAPFLALLVGAAQLFVVFQSQAILESATESAGRQILTGNVQNQGMSQSQFQSLVCGYIPAILSCSGVIVDVQVAKSFSSANTSTPTLTYNRQGQVTNTWQFNPGAQGSVVVLRVLYQLPVLAMPGFSVSNLSNGSRLLIATSVFKNELY